MAMLFSSYLRQMRKTDFPNKPKSNLTVYTSMENTPQSMYIHRYGYERKGSETKETLSETIVLKTKHFGYLMCNAKIHLYLMRLRKSPSTEESFRYRQKPGTGQKQVLGH